MTEYDPWDDSQDGEKPANTGRYWGQLQLDRWNCQLVKGQGKIAWDEASGKKPTVAVDLLVSPLPEMAIKYSVERRMVNFEAAWTRVSHPSLKAAGVTDLRKVTGLWALVEVAPTGETYYSKKDQDANGNPLPGAKPKEKTGLKIIRIFADEAECRADYLAAQNGAAPAPATSTPPMQAAEDDGKAKAFPFMRVVVSNVVKKSGTDLAVIAEEIAKFPMVRDHFTVDSPEVQEIIMQAAAVAA